MGKSSSSSSSSDYKEDYNGYNGYNGDYDEGGKAGGDEYDMEDKHHEDMKELMANTCWIYFCCCVGEGCSQLGDPLFLGQSKICCFESSLHTTDCCGDEGCCYDLGKCCCLLHVGAFPPGGGPHDGIPLCAVCNQRCGGEDEDAKASDLAQYMNDTFLVFYCCCSGFGCIHPTDPIIKAASKFFCIKTQCHTGDPCDDELGCCYQYQKTCCFVTVGVCPPGGGRHDGIPTLACCGATCIGEDTDGGSEAPSQMEMK